MTRTCALCGYRDALGVTDWEGREVPCCMKCARPKIEVPRVSGLSTRVRARSVADRIVRFTARTDATLQEIAAAVHAPIDQVAQRCATLARKGRISYREIAGRGRLGKIRIYTKKEAA